MKIELNAQELEAAVIAHLSNSGLDLKKKTITFEFEGMCSIDIEAEEVTTPTAKKAPTKRAARKPKVVEETPEPVKEPVAEEKPKKAAAKPKVEEVVEPESTEEKVEKPSAAALFNTAPSEEDTSINIDDGDNSNEDTSLFG